MFLLKAAETTTSFSPQQMQQSSLVECNQWMKLFLFIFCPTLTETFRNCSRVSASVNISCHFKLWANKQTCLKKTFTKSRCFYSSELLQVLSFASHAIIYPSAMRKSHKEQTHSRLSSTPRASPLSVLLSHWLHLHQYLQTPRAGCSDRGSKVRPVYPLRCQS